MQGARVTIVDSKMGGSLTPLCVTWTTNADEKKRLIGKPAITGRMRNLEISLGYITRLLDVQEDQKELERQFIYHSSQLDRNLLVSINEKVSEPLEID